MSQIMNNRDFMKCPNFSRGMKKTDQQAGVPHPPHNKETKGNLIILPDFEKIATDDSYINLLANRRSVRTFVEDAPITQAQLAYMLYTANSIQEIKGSKGEATMRPVPSGGARHAFEIYAAVQNVEGLEPGIYHYAPAANIGKKTVAVEYIGAIENHKETINNMTAEQGWTKTAPVVLFITCLPYRAEWRYSEMAHRVVLIDLGHLGQNIMLSAVSLGLGSCCMAAFNQKVCDDILNIDGVDEFTVYVIAMGVPKA